MRHVLMVLLAALCVSQVRAQWAGELVEIDEPQAEDVYAAGRDVKVVADVEQDVTSAGQRVSISGRVGGDVIAAGETVIVRGQVLDDVRAAGRRVSVYGKVVDHVVVAGQSVHLVQESATCHPDRRQQAGRSTGRPGPPADRLPAQPRAADSRSHSVSAPT
jgi:cytoskeletal protein CcmA (bactofilin family)